MKLTVLIENETSRRDLNAEHGLAFLLEIDGKRILFDTGSSGAVWENAARLGTFPENIDIVVLSHSHYDHGGGFVSGVLKGLSCPVVCGQGFFDRKYRKGECRGLYTDLSCGFDRSFVENKGLDLQECGEVLRLTEHCYALGRFKRANKWEEISSRFLKERDCAAVPDDFEDEICLAAELDGGEGIGVIAGCSHPGIINMLETVRERFPGKELVFVAGGIHLKDAGEARKQKTMEAFQRLQVKRLFLNHCSGEIPKQEAGSGPELWKMRGGDCLIL